MADHFGVSRTLVRQGRIDRCHCPSCGYNAKHSIMRGRCPECGSDWSDSDDDEFPDEG